MALLERWSATDAFLRINNDLSEHDCSRDDLVDLCDYVARLEQALDQTGAWRYVR